MTRGGGQEHADKVYREWTGEIPSGTETSQLAVLKQHGSSLARHIDFSYAFTLLPQNLPPQLTVGGVGVVAARGVFSPLLLALHLSGGGGSKRGEMTSEKMFTMKTEVLMK